MDGFYYALNIEPQNALIYINKWSINIIIKSIDKNNNKK